MKGGEKKKEEAEARLHICCTGQVLLFSDRCFVSAISEAVPAQKCSSVFLIPRVKSEMQDDAPTNVHIMAIQGSFQHDP